MSSTSSTLFTGSSRFSNDFQQIIQRAVSIASLPITQLSNQKTLLSQKQSAYYSITTKIAAVDAAVQKFASTVGTSSYTGTSSKTDVASATLSDGALEGSYDINVIDAGSTERDMSQDPGVTSGLTQVTDPSTQNVVSGSSFTLNVDGTPTTLNLTSTSLTDLAKAINNAGAGVQATVINIGGTGSSADYRLSVQSTGVGSHTISLKSGSTEVLEQLSAGTPVVYQVNGNPPLSGTPPTGGNTSNSRNLVVSPGVTVNVLGEGETTITVKRQSGALNSALSTLVSAYNSAVDELSQHRGQGSGVLKGDSEIWTLSSQLRSLINFSSGGSGVSSLTHLGLKFEQTGHLSFDSTKLDDVSLQAVSDFFGDGKTSGFIYNAQNILKGIDDETNGSLPATIKSLTSQITNTSAQIDAEQDRVNVLQDSLNAKMARADALVASLEQQSSYFTNLYDAMKSSNSN